MTDEPKTVEFFTHQHRIVGAAQLGVQRLTDILNDDLTSSVELEDVRILRLLTPSKVVAAHDSALIDKQCILFASVVCRAVMLRSVASSSTLTPRSGASSSQCPPSS